MVRYLILFLFLAPTLHAQSFLWERMIPGDWIYSIEVTPDGGYIVAGSTYSHGEDTVQGHGGEDWQVAKLAADGTVQWRKKYGGRGNDGADAVAVMPNGDYVVVGSVQAIDSVTGNFQATLGMILRLRPDGSVVWMRRYGQKNASLYAVQSTFDGGIIAAGCNHNPEHNTRTSYGHNDYWILKITADGDVQWQKLFGTGSPEDLCSVKQTRDGGYIAVGEHGKVIKLSTNGDVQWERYYLFDWDDNLKDVIQSDDGGYVLVGYTESKDAPGFRGVRDIWIVKLDDLGVIEWETVAGGSKIEGATAVQQSRDGGYIVGGYGPGWSLFIAKFSPKGKLLWNHRLPGTYGQGSTPMRITSDGNYIIGCNKGCGQECGGAWVGKVRVLSFEF